MKNILLILVLCIWACASLMAQTQIQLAYNIDLTKIRNDKLQVVLNVPALSRQNLVFALPKIIPGTYNISDFGKFVSDLEAWDANGKKIPVQHPTENTWTISTAENLRKITYSVEDIFDTKQKHNVYAMAATNFEAGGNFVLNMPGIVGFFEGLEALPARITFKKPASFYASTAASPVSSVADEDEFAYNNIHEVYDQPVMYNLPDTATVKVGNCSVLVSVYSPNKLVKASSVAEWLSEMLHATLGYLNGKLPVEKYAFIYYFKPQSAKYSFPPEIMGALEHTTSSFYYLPESSEQLLRNTIVNMSSHEFLHIITPLTIASKEIKLFNYLQPDLSKHLWLYEGVTEYTAHHVQVKGRLITPEQFLGRLSEKITDSRRSFNDTLSFTLLSKGSAGQYASQYINVYEKGAMIGACLDIYLLYLSKGRYGLKNLVHDLSIKYGKEHFFYDDQLFETIEQLTYPEIGKFFRDYVAGNKPIPYAYFFGLAGIEFLPKVSSETISFGGIAPQVNEQGIVFVSEQSTLNGFGKKMGYKVGDELYSFNGITLNEENLAAVIDSLKGTLKKGDTLKVKIGRKGQSKVRDTLVLSQPVMPVITEAYNQLKPREDPALEEFVVFNSWLKKDPCSEVEKYEADSADVSSVDAVIKALYSVMSGPKGERNWKRFHSLFAEAAHMGPVPKAGAPVTFVQSTPDDYQRQTSPLFRKDDFYEQELSREVVRFGNNVVNVESAYQFRLKKDGPVVQRGINNFTLVWSKGRWWILDLVWQKEDKDHPLKIKKE